MEKAAIGTVCPCEDVKFCPILIRSLLGVRKSLTVGAGGRTCPRGSQVVFAVQTKKQSTLALERACEHTLVRSRGLCLHRFAHGGISAPWLAYAIPTTQTRTVNFDRDSSVSFAVFRLGRRYLHVTPVPVPSVYQLAIHEQRWGIGYSGHDGQVVLFRGGVAFGDEVVTR